MTSGISSRDIANNTENGVRLSFKSNKYRARYYMFAVGILRQKC